MKFDFFWKIWSCGILSGFTSLILLFLIDYIFKTNLREYTGRIIPFITLISIGVIYWKILPPHKES